MSTISQEKIGERSEGNVSDRVMKQIEIMVLLTVQETKYKHKSACTAPTNEFLLHGSLDP